MKTETPRNRPAAIANTRWAVYAAAGAATALVGSNSAEGAIHYSGILNETFPPHTDKAVKLQLDQNGDSLSFQRLETSVFGRGHDLAGVYACGIISGGVRERISSSRPFVSKLSFGQTIPAGFFINKSSRYGLGVLASFAFSLFYDGDWGDRGAGYVGFRFNNGAGKQYGWARVRMKGQPENGFKVVDYAYADPGEPITAGQKRAGQTSSEEPAADQGSLGWLAVGAVGLIAWRKSRSRSVR